MGCLVKAVVFGVAVALFVALLPHSLWLLLIIIIYLMMKK